MSHSQSLSFNAKTRGSDHGRAQTRHATLREIEFLAKMLDTRFSLLGFRFGWDSVIGLIPGVGDTITTGLSAYLIWRAHQLGAGTGLKLRMAANVGLDWLIGLIPLVGDLGDAAFRSNTRNVRLLQEHLQRTGR